MANERPDVTPVPPRRTLLMTKCPVTSKARKALIETILANFLAIFPHDPKTQLGKATVASCREGLDKMSAGKLHFLAWAADPDSDHHDMAARMDAAKKCRVSHDTTLDWEMDKQFCFFRNYLTLYFIETRMLVHTLEGVYYAVSRRDYTGNPVIDEAFRDMAKQTLQHHDYVKGGGVNINLNAQGQVTEDSKKKFEELAEMARKNPEAARIIEVFERARLEKEKDAVQTGATIGADGGLKETGE